MMYRFLVYIHETYLYVVSGSRSSSVCSSPALIHINCLSPISILYQTYLYVVSGSKSSSVCSSPALIHINCLSPISILYAYISLPWLCGSFQCKCTLVADGDARMDTTALGLDDGVRHVATVLYKPAPALLIAWTLNAYNVAGLKPLTSEFVLGP